MEYIRIVADRRELVGVEGRKKNASRLKQTGGNINLRTWKTQKKVHQADRRVYQGCSSQTKW